MAKCNNEKVDHLIRLFKHSFFLSTSGKITVGLFKKYFALKLDEKVVPLSRWK
jgi:hypothetical protein